MTSFVGCSFPETKLSNLDFSDVSVKNCNFAHAIIKYSVFEQRRSGTKNERKTFNLSKVVFDETELTGTIFSSCNLEGAGFQKANLESVVFEKCNLKEANLGGANISGTNFSDSKIDHTILDFEGFITFGNSKGFSLEQLNKDC